MNLTRLKSQLPTWQYKLAAFDDRLRGRGLPSLDDKMRKAFAAAFRRMRDQFQPERLLTQLQQNGIALDGEPIEITDDVKQSILSAVSLADIPQFSLGDARNLTPLYAQAYRLGKDLARRRVRQKIRDKKIRKAEEDDRATEAAILLLLDREADLSRAERARAQQRMLASLARANRATRNRIAEMIIIAAREGESFSSVAESIDGQLDRWESWRARTLGRTETETLGILGLLSGFRSLHITVYVWECGVAPCPICIQNCNRERTTGQSFDSGDTEPPAHPNCVCTLTPIVTEDTLTSLGIAATIGQFI